MSSRWPKRRHALRAGSLRVGLVALALACTALASAEEALRDPTRPYPYKPVAAGLQSERKLSLTAIVVSERRRVAVVNGRAVGQGERIAGAEVVEILLHAIKLRRGGRITTVPLAPTKIRREGGARGKE